MERIKNSEASENSPIEDAGKLDVEPRGNVEGESSDIKKENIETTPEKIMEKARERRLGIAGKTFDRVADKLHISPPAKRLISWLINLTPVSAPKMIFESVRGETFGGEKMTAYDRLMHLSIQATNIIAWGLATYSLSTGQHEYLTPAKFYAASWGLWAVYELPKIIKNSKQLAESENENASKFFTKMNEMFSKAKERILKKNLGEKPESPPEDIVLEGEK